MLKRANYIYSLALLVLILSASCSSDQQSEEHDAPEFYDLSKCESVKVGDVLEVAEMIPLLFERDTYPKRGTYVNFLDSNIIIEDSEDKIHVFSSDGHYIGCSESMRGQGPGEHTMLLGHIVNPFTHTIDLLSINKILSHDAEFTSCERESKLPTIVGSADKLLYDDGIALSESLYLLHSSEVTSPYKIILYDASAGKEINSWNYSDDIIAFFNRSFKKFTKMPDDEILITGEGFTPYIYGYNGERSGFYKAIEFKYNDKTITDHVILDDFRKNHKILFDYCANNEVPLQRILNSKKIVNIILTGTDVYRDQYVIITDRESGKNYKYDIVDDGLAAPPSFQLMDENYLYSVFPKYRILENPGYVLNKVGEVDSLLAGIDDEDFVLIKYRFKK